ncbi:MAG: pitrilysin family protein [Candidatus Gracilibacteria bacterium]|jgi:predicted Zn-dependent peptidase
MLKKTALQNGLRIVTKKLDNTKSVTVLILVGAGSRYEIKELNGISHFLEHMFFKGAEKYTNTKEVSEAIDSVGGDFNAFTGKEYAGYYIKVADRHVDLALDVLADMLIHSKFDPAEIDKERGVIMEEYNMYQDTPMYQIGWDFERLIYGDQPIGWDQVGTKEVIMGIKQADFIKYKKELYVPGNTVIAVSGNVDHDEMVKAVSKLFTFEDAEKAYNFNEVKDVKVEKKIYLRNKKTEQAHVILGFPGYSEQHKDHYAAKLLGIVLGGNMSSRMFLSVREKQGLAYYINTSTDDYTDTGTFSTNAGVSLDGIDKAITAIVEEYKKVLTEPVPEAELLKSKEFLKGKMVLRLEDSEEYAHLLGKFELLYGNVETPEEIMKMVDAVTVEDLGRVARDLFKEENLRIAIIGPYDDEERFLKLLKF